MADVQGITKIGPLNYSGYIDWPKLYTVVTNWAKAEKMKIFEPAYKDKTDGQGFTEREITLTFLRKVDRMNRYEITIQMRLWDCQPVEITKNGAKKIVDRGRIRVNIDSQINRDWQNIFDESFFTKKLRRVFYTLRNWEWNLKHADTVLEKTYDLQKVIKEALEMDTA